MKYRPDFPPRFHSILEARAFCETFFHWYNQKHHHSGPGLMTPAAIHYGQAERLRDNRARVLECAYLNHPERFVHGTPQPTALPQAVWINPPKNNQETH